MKCYKDFRDVWVLDMVGEMEDLPPASSENGTNVRHGSVATNSDADVLCRLTAAELTSLYLKRKASPVEVVQSVLARTASINEQSMRYHPDDGR